MNKIMRIGAAIIDVAAVMVLLKIFMFICVITGLYNIFVLTGTNLIIDFFKVLLYICCTTFIFIMYNSLMLWKFNKTFGKMMLSVNVKKTVENKFQSAFIREYYKWTLVVSTFGIYIILCLFKMLVKQNTEFYYEKISKIYCF